MTIYTHQAKVQRQAKAFLQKSLLHLGNRVFGVLRRSGGRSETRRKRASGRSPATVRRTVATGTAARHAAGRCWYDREMKILLMLALAAPTYAADYQLKATPATVAWGYYWSAAKPVLRIT